MATRGFTSTNLQEGWTLFTTAAGAKMDVVPTSPGTPSDAEAREALASLDIWENTWFPVISATLERHFPAIHAKVFLNLSQTVGRAVIISVKTMLDRLAGLEKQPNGEAAMKLLVTRGLTPEKIEDAQKLLKKLQAQGEAVIPTTSPASREEQEKALVDVWAWYREWSAIARTVITRGDVLARLGLRKLKRGSDEEGEEEDEGVPPDPTKPAVAAPK
ncbi:MAG: hypothetical protein HY901_12490 [Deltaproteobacteria bacterium]|nr:hypothetical protein [Deltaproteobacteria bacterium]